MTKNIDEVEVEKRNFSQQQNFEKFKVSTSS